MLSWYELEACDPGVIVGGQVCLVRNVDGFPFAGKMNRGQRVQLSDLVRRAVQAEEDRLQTHFTYIPLSGEAKSNCGSLISTLAIPPNMHGEAEEEGLLLSEDESISILVGGKEHLCVQVSCPGQKVRLALRKANEVDDAINRHLPYAFSSKYGYLTASPLYTGTGLQISYLLHLHYLEKRRKIAKIEKEFSQYGFSLRQHFSGEGEAPGCIYRIKNRKTLGLSEAETLSALEFLAQSLQQSENNAYRQRSLEEEEKDLDQMYRAYGLLRYARDLDCEEALNYLSFLRLADRHQIWGEDILTGRFSAMVRILDAVLLQNAEDSQTETGKLRADYIRSVLPAID